MKIKTLAIFGTLLFSCVDLEGNGPVAHESEANQSETSIEERATRRAHWVNTSSMGAGRENHTATLLRSGDVLVAGGASGPDLTPVATAELYNPRSDTWSNAASPSFARSNHTATELPNGMVLVSGGVTTGGDPVAVAEIYNPRTGTWSVAGTMSEPRGFHTATLLHSGKVLVAGGFTTAAEPVASAEIFDPSTRTWTPTGSMSVGRFAVAPTGGAVSLCDGRVMFAGGDEGGTAEIFNPRTGIWSAAAPLPVPVATHSVTRLSTCEVLVAGGQKLGVPFPDIGTLETYTYNVRRNAWRRAGDLHSPRYWFPSATLYTGEVVIAGGSGVDADPTTTEIYNPATRQWTVIPGPPSMRIFSTLTRLHSGRLLMAGGAGPVDAPLNTTETLIPR